MARGPVRAAEQSAPEVEAGETILLEPEKQLVFTDAQGTKHYAKPAQPAPGPFVRPDGVSAERQRIASKLAEEQAQADRERALRRAALKGKDGKFRRGRDEVRAMQAFPDAVNLDGSQMTDKDAAGKVVNLVKPGFESRWVRFEEGLNGKWDQTTRIDEFEAAGWEIVRNLDGTPKTGRFGQAMQAPVDVAAKWTFDRTPDGVMDKDRAMEILEERAAEQNVGLAYKQVMPYTGSRIDRHQEEHVIRLGE